MLPGRTTARAVVPDGYELPALLVSLAFVACVVLHSRWRHGKPDPEHRRAAKPAGAVLLVVWLVFLARMPAGEAVG
jgi:hypothetical protein